MDNFTKWQFLFWGVFLFFCGFLLSNLFSSPEKNIVKKQPETSLAITGKHIFVQYCSSCHGLDGRGNGPTAEVISVPPADLTKIAKRRGGSFPAAEIASYIDGRTVIPGHGTREMPVWGRRFSDNIRDESLREEIVRGNLTVLVEHLKSIQE